jgi:hypothetical protein
MGFLGSDDAFTETLAAMTGLLRTVLRMGATGFGIAPQRSPPQEQDDLPILLDAAAAFAAAFAAGPGMAWLVRPDGYIGWCSAAPSVDGLRSFLATIAASE